MFQSLVQFLFIYIPKIQIFYSDKSKNRYDPNFDPNIYTMQSSNES